jgi:peptide/nickel transport system substrate-binding protein
VFSGISLLDRGGKLSKPLGDVRVRQAINYALDRQAVTTAIFGEWAIPTTQTLNGEGYQESLDSYYAYDVEKAKQLMAEAGYADGFELPVVSTSFFSGDQMVQAIAGQLAEIGITLKIDSKSDVNEYVTVMSSGEAPASWIGFGSLPMFIEGPQLFMPNALFNPFHTESPELTDLYAKLAIASDADRKSISEQIETYLVEQAWFAQVAWVPLGTYSSAKVDTQAIDASTGLVPIVSIADLKPAA